MKRINLMILLALLIAAFAACEKEVIEPDPLVDPVDSTKVVVDSIKYDSIMVTGVVTNVTEKAGSDGSIVLTVTGGSESYTYLWSTNATTKDLTGLKAEEYSVTVSDTSGNKSALTSFTVTEPGEVIAYVPTIDTNYVYTRIINTSTEYVNIDGGDEVNLPTLPGNTIDGTEFIEIWNNSTKISTYKGSRTYIAAIKTEDGVLILEQDIITIGNNSKVWINTTAELYKNSSTDVYSQTSSEKSTITSDSITVINEVWINDTVLNINSETIIDELTTITTTTSAKFNNNGTLFKFVNFFPDGRWIYGTYNYDNKIGVLTLRNNLSNDSGKNPRFFVNSHDDNNGGTYTIKDKTANMNMMLVDMFMNVNQEPNNNIIFIDKQYFIDNYANGKDWKEAAAEYAYYSPFQTTFTAADRFIWDLNYPVKWY